MPIKITSYMGPVGFYLRKIMPKLTSTMYIRLQSQKRNNESIEFMQQVIEQSKTKNIYPTYVAVETINRCNGTCPFCPANRHDESRPFAKMSDNVFNSIVNELSSWKGWDGVLSLYVNNEPFMDTTMCDKLIKVRKALPKARMLVFTNGSLLDENKLMVMSKAVDELIINNYSTKYSLTEENRRTYQYVKKNSEKFKDIKIVIQKRYANEYLTNRAGAAPNKKEAVGGVNLPCLMPFTDLTIYPSGQIGLCCSDVLETMDLGNIKENSLLSIYNNEHFRHIREQMILGRKNIPICANCDFIDSGIRLDMMHKKI